MYKIYQLLLIMQMYQPEILCKFQVFEVQLSYKGKCKCVKFDYEFNLFETGLILLISNVGGEKRGETSNCHLNLLQLTKTHQNG